MHELASRQIKKAKELLVARNLNVRVLLIIVLIANLWHILARTDHFFLLCYSLVMKNLCTMVLVSCVAGVPVVAAVANEAEDRTNNEAEIRLTVEAEHEYGTGACQATIEIEYYQKGPSAHVESTLTNGDCGASSGTYVIQIRYRGADRQSQSKEFAETWERADSNPVVVEKDYFVADDIDILRVRSRKLDCTCVPGESDDGS